ncbi:MAG: mercury(II) reductase [Acidobacteriota bacterium]
MKDRSEHEVPQQACCASQDDTTNAGDGADLIVIGGGSAGFAAAIRGHELGAQVVMVNDGTIGGTCVNVGCVPSKTLIRAAEARHRAARTPFEGIETSSRVTDFGAVIRQKDELVASLREAKYEEVLAAHDRVRLVRGRARLGRDGSVRVGGRTLRAERVIVATGSRPRLPEIPGLRDARPLDSTALFSLDGQPESLIVLGGRYVALECAQMMSRLGTRVTLLQRSEHVLPTESEELTSSLERYLRGEGVDVVTSVTIEQVTRTGGRVAVKARVAGEPRTFRAAEILAATGRRPNTDGMDLEQAGIALDPEGHVVVDETLESTRRGVYAAGDVAGEPAFVYTAAYEGRLAADNALGPARRARDYRALPWVVFTDPQVAGVGLDARQAEEQGIAVDVARLGLEHVPRALAARDTRGFVELVRRRGSDELLGARVLAPEGGELVMEAALAIRHGIGVSQLASAFHPYLTLAEGIKLCAQAFDRDVARLSCCSA